MMIPGVQGRALHACMRKHDFLPLVSSRRHLHMDAMNMEERRECNERITDEEREKIL